jgi:transcriptional regulator with XRE-family HTH domain
MKKYSEDIFKDVEEFFASEPTSNEKAWGLIHDFYHIILTYMERQHISKAELANRLKKSRSAITQLFNKTPNITLKKMVEIADALGLDLQISSPQIQAEKEEKKQPITVSYQIFIPAPLERSIENFPPHSAWTYHGVTLGKADRAPTFPILS